MDTLKSIQRWHVAAQAGSPLKDEPAEVKLQQAINLFIEEVNESKEALLSGDKQHAAHELADVIFVIVNLMNQLGYDARSVTQEIIDANRSKIFHDITYRFNKEEIESYCEEKNATVRRCGRRVQAIYGENGKMKKGPLYVLPDYRKFKPFNND